MNPRNTLILAAVVAALGAFVYVYEIRGEAGRREAEEVAKRVFSDLEADDVEWIALRTSDGRDARLERAGSDEGGAGGTGGAWRLVEPVAFPADQTAADGIASALAGLTSEAVFEEPEALSEYGLDGEPALRFGVAGAEQTLRVGDKTPVGANTYLAAADDPRVFVVATYRTSALTKELDQLREARVLDFDRNAVTGLRASWPGGSVRLEKGDAGWRLVEPLEGPADGRTVENLLSDLSFLRASSFIDEPPPDAEVGLDQPEFAVELTTASGDTAKTVALAIGASGDGEFRAVRGRAENALYRINESRLEDFPRRATLYRFRELARFKATDAGRFELVFHDEGAAQSWVLSGEKAGGGWQTHPDPMAPGKAARLIAELSDLRAEDIAAEGLPADGLAELGLSPPRVLVRVHPASGEAPDEGEEAESAAAPLALLEIGVADPERGLAARVAGGEIVYWLDYDLAEHLPISQEAFANRFVSKEEAEAGEETGDEAAEAPGAESDSG